MICKALLQKGANPSVRGKDGKSAAEMAESAGNTELAHFLQLRERDAELKVTKKQGEEKQEGVNTDSKGAASSKNAPKGKRGPAEKG